MKEISKLTSFHMDRPLDSKAFKKVLAEAGYSQTALAETVGITCAHERQDVEVVYRRVRSDTPYNILVRLFWLGQSVQENIVRRVLASLDIEGLEGIGLLDRQDGCIRSNSRLAPYHDLMLASDFGPEINRQLSTDHVLGVGAASITLANLTVRQKVKTVLDVGSGAGIQSFLAARHAESVIGTDTSRRALNFAEFNAGLNNISGVEWRQGNLYEPVAGQKFDLIVSNPPFVISPESRFVFRDAGLPGDTISQRVICGAGERLDENGFACILFNWHHHDDTDFDIRPKEWVAGSGCDSWMICFKSAEPLVYAADWLGSSIGQNSQEYGRCLDEWSAYYEKMNIGRISAGAIIMRRKSRGPNWFRSHVIDKGRCTGPASEQIERIFAAEDILEASDDRQLLQQRLVFDGNHRLEHQLAAEDGRWVIRGEHLYASEGVPFAGTVDMYIANLLACCDGKRALGEIIESAAGRIKADREEFTRACLKAIRKLMQAGFLRVAANPGQTC